MAMSVPICNGTKDVVFSSGDTCLRTGERMLKMRGSAAAENNEGSSSVWTTEALSTAMSWFRYGTKSVSVTG
jgi:hypothetical protein